MATRNNNTAFIATHPGEILKEELRERGITQKEFAASIGMRASHLSELINGKRSITIAIADKLQQALDIDSQSWINMQTQYNYDKRMTANCKTEKSATIQVSVDDASIIPDLKRAIGMLRGVKRVVVI